MKMLLRAAAVAVYSSLFVSGGAMAEVDSLRLYTFDCGTIEMNDLGLFSREGKYDGQTNSAVDSCYLIRHPKGDLLWDTGLPEELIALPEGLNNGAFHLKVSVKLTDQLQSIGVSPADIEYLSVSHSHFDHVGNAGKFAASTFIVNPEEYAHMFSAEAKADPDTFGTYAALENAKRIEFTKTHDVFGDGKVVIHAMPGHTPGHSVLLVRLDNSGSVLLTGDMYHLTRARELKTVPKFNTDAEQSKASMQMFEALAASENARVVIQHERADVSRMPKLPAYLD